MRIRDHVSSFFNEEEKNEWEKIRKEDKPYLTGIVDFFCLENYFKNSEYLDYKGLSEYEKDEFLKKWSNITDLRCAISHDNSYLRTNENRKQYNLTEIRTGIVYIDIQKEREIVEDFIWVNNKLGLLTATQFGVNIFNMSPESISELRFTNNLKKQPNINSIRIQMYFALITERFSFLFSDNKSNLEFSQIFGKYLEAKRIAEKNQGRNPKKRLNDVVSTIINSNRRYKEYHAELIKEEIDRLFRKEEKDWLVKIRNKVYHFHPISDEEARPVQDWVNKVSMLLDIPMDDIMLQFENRYNDWHNTYEVNPVPAID